VRNEYRWGVRPVPRIGLVVLAALVLLRITAPVSAEADLLTFGSSLDVPATKDTANDIGYAGTDVSFAGQVFHVNHDGADTALWNVKQGTGNPQAPADGQVLSVRQEGCAQPAPGGPTPLTQIHYQDIVALSDGGFKVNVTSQPFDLPICGVAGASGNTITTYHPENLCVTKGNYIAFNDEGGFDSRYYPSGVPYRVIGDVPGSVMDSFIRNAGTLNGAVFRPTDTTNHDGFAVNPNKEVLTQVQLGTAADAVWLCPGGSKGAPHTASPPAAASPPATASSPGAAAQTVNKRGMVTIPVACHARTRCRGTVRLDGKGLSLQTVYSIAPGKKGRVNLKIPIRVLQELFAKNHGPVTATITLRSANAAVPAYTRNVTLRAAKGLLKALHYR
jgi:hypothetical protein